MREAIPSDKILVTGNTVVDAMLQTLSRPLAGKQRPTEPNYILVTVHRRESHGPVLEDICDGIVSLLEQNSDVSVIIPMHPNPNVRDVLISRLGKHPRVSLQQPLGYAEFIHILNGAVLVLTDSGGVQEECAVLGKPVLVLRTHTERPEAVEAGVSIVVGTDPRRITEEANRLISKAKIIGKTSRSFHDFRRRRCVQTDSRCLAPCQARVFSGPSVAGRHQN